MAASHLCRHLAVHTKQIIHVYADLLFRVTTYNFNTTEKKNTIRTHDPNSAQHDRFNDFQKLLKISLKKYCPLAINTISCENFTRDKNSCSSSNLCSFTKAMPTHHNHHKKVNITSTKPLTLSCHQTTRKLVQHTNQLPQHNGFRQPAQHNRRNHRQQCKHTWRQQRSKW